MANMEVYRELLEDEDMMDEITEEFMKATGLDKVIAEKDRNIAEKDRDLEDMRKIVEKLMAENAALKAAKG